MSDAERSASKTQSGQTYHAVVHGGRLVVILVAVGPSSVGWLAARSRDETDYVGGDPIVDNHAVQAGDRLAQIETCDSRAQRD